MKAIAITFPPEGGTTNVGQDGFPIRPARCVLSYFAPWFLFVVPPSGGIVIAIPLDEGYSDHLSA
jgi:hypothetical protein